MSIIAVGVRIFEGVQQFVSLIVNLKKKNGKSTKKCGSRLKTNIFFHTEHFPSCYLFYGAFMSLSLWFEVFPLMKQQCHRTVE